MNYLPLPENKKLFVTYHIESGCLGPEGRSHIAEFCQFSQTELKTVDTDYIAWHIVPRRDKKSPEMQYHVGNKRMNYAQAEKYLAVFDKSLDEFEGHLGDKLVMLIDTFMNR